MDKKDKQNVFLQCFIGEEVEILLNASQKIEEANEEGMISQQNPLMVRGFILDIDEEYIYLGRTPDGITRFVRKEAVIGGDVVDANGDGFDEILENLPVEGNGN